MTRRRIVRLIAVPTLFACLLALPLVGCGHKDTSPPIVGVWTAHGTGLSGNGISETWRFDPSGTVSMSMASDKGSYPPLTMNGTYKVEGNNVAVTGKPITFGNEPQSTAQTTTNFIYTLSGDMLTLTGAGKDSSVQYVLTRQKP